MSLLTVVRKNFYNIVIQMESFIENLDPTAQWHSSEIIWFF